MMTAHLPVPWNDFQLHKAIAGIVLTDPVNSWQQSAVRVPS